MLAIGVTLNWSPEVEKNQVDKEEKNPIENLRNKSIGIYKNVATRREKRIHPVKRPKKYSKTKQKNTTIFVLYTTTITTQKMLRFRSHYELSYFS